MVRGKLLLACLLLAFVVAFATATSVGRHRRHHHRHHRLHHRLRHHSAVKNDYEWPADTDDDSDFDSDSKPHLFDEDKTDSTVNQLPAPASTAIISAADEDLFIDPSDVPPVTIIDDNQDQNDGGFFITALGYNPQPVIQDDDDVEPSVLEDDEDDSDDNNDGSLLQVESMKARDKDFGVQLGSYSFVCTDKLDSTKSMSGVINNVVVNVEKYDSAATKVFYRTKQIVGQDSSNKKFVLPWTQDGTTNHPPIGRWGVYWQDDNTLSFKFRSYDTSTDWNSQIDCVVTSSGGDLGALSTLLQTTVLPMPVDPTSKDTDPTVTLNMRPYVSKGPYQVNSMAAGLKKPVDYYKAPPKDDSFYPGWAFPGLSEFPPGYQKGFRYSFEVESTMTGILQLYNPVLDKNDPSTNLRTKWQVLNQKTRELVVTKSCKTPKTTSKLDSDILTFCRKPKKGIFDNFKFCGGSCVTDEYLKNRPDFQTKCGGRSFDFSTILPSYLSDEGTGFLWEVAHQKYVENPWLLKAQLECFLLFLTPKGQDPPKSLHIHVSFPASPYPRQNKLIMSQAVFWNDLFNAQRYAFETDYAARPYMSVTGSQQVKDAMADLENGLVTIEEIDTAGHNWGNFKCANIALRHNVYGDGMLGFEFRLGTRFLPRYAQILGNKWKTWTPKSNGQMPTISTTVNAFADFVTAFVAPFTEFETVSDGSFNLRKFSANTRFVPPLTTRSGFSYQRMFNYVDKYRGDNIQDTVQFDKSQKSPKFSGLYASSPRSSRKVNSVMWSGWSQMTACSVSKSSIESAQKALRAAVSTCTKADDCNTKIVAAAKPLFQKINLCTLSS